MKSGESLKALLDLPEMSSVGSTQERVAFILLRIEGRTVRDTAQVLGVSKSQVPNLAMLFLTKLGVKIKELDRKPAPAVSKEYLECRDALRHHLYELQDESGSVDYATGGHKIGNFSPGSVSREDWAEARGLLLNDLYE